MKKTELILEQVDKLRKIKLPPEWEVAKLEVKFKRNGLCGEWATVVYDDLNNVFYVKTNKCIVYPDDQNALKEGLDIMNIANKILKQ